MPQGAHATTTRLWFKKGRGENRMVKIISSPYLPERDAQFGIQDGGITDASAPRDIDDDRITKASAARDTDADGTTDIDAARDIDADGILNVSTTNL